MGRTRYFTASFMNRSCISFSLAGSFAATPTYITANTLTSDSTFYGLVFKNSDSLSRHDIGRSGSR